MSFLELEGKTYSVQFLDSGGKAKADEAFDRHLARPDRNLSTALAVTLFFPFIGIFTLPLSIYYFFKTLRFRRENEMNRKLVGGCAVAIYGTLIALLVLGVVLWFAAIAGVFR